MPLLDASQQAALGAFALPGPNEVNGRIGVVVISEERQEAERLQNVVRTGIVRILFE